MNPELSELLDEVVDRERVAFDVEHPADDSALYSRVISPIRRVRRLAPLAAVAVLAMIAVTGLALAGLARPALEVAADPASPAASSAGRMLLSDPDAVAGEAGWTVNGRVIDPYASASPALATVGPVFGESVACGALEAFGRLIGHPDGSTAVHLGAFPEPEGAANDVHLRTFATALDAESYVAELWRITRRCTEDLAEWDVDVEAAHVGVTGVPGEAVALAVPVPVTDEAWRLWVHRDGRAVLAVTTDPGAADLGAAITLDWSEGGLR